MVREAEEFASEDEAQRKRVEALNSLSGFVFGLKAQLADQEGLGGKVRYVCFFNVPLAHVGVG
jgi:endoplasmic reticulum chaperone BiP